MTSSPTCSSAPSIAESTSSITLHSPTREQTADSLKDLNNYSHSSTYKQFTDSDDFTELQLSTNTNRRKITSTSLLLQNQIKQLISSHAQKNNRNLNFIIILLIQHVFFLFFFFLILFFYVFLFFFYFFFLIA